MSEPSDEALFLAYKRGELLAFDQLFERWRGPLTSYAWRMLRRREEAEEVCLEAFCRVLEGAWRPGGSLRSFLFTIAHRLCLDRIRKRGRVRQFFSLLTQPEAAPDTPERLAGDNQAVARLEAAMAALPEQSRAVLLLYYHQDLSSKEVAEVLGIDDGQVRSRLAYARRLLREALGDDA